MILQYGDKCCSCVSPYILMCGKEEDMVIHSYYTDHPMLNPYLSIITVRTSLDLQHETIIQSPYARLLQRRPWLIAEPQTNVDSVHIGRVLGQWNNSSPLQEYLSGHGSFHIVHVLCGLGESIRPCPLWHLVSYGSMGYQGVAVSNSVLI